MKKSEVVTTALAGVGAATVITGAVITISKRIKKYKDSKDSSTTASTEESEETTEEKVEEEI